MAHPRSPTYDRLESGMGPGKNAKKRFAWKKFAIGAVVILALIYLFGPRETRPKLPWSSTDVEEDVSLPPETHHDTRPPTHGTDIDDVDALPPSHNSNTHPTTFSEDRDPSTTTYCSKSDAVRFALMIDAGSTGSRVHIYKFNTCSSTQSKAEYSYEYEVFKETKPGLSKFPTALSAASSLDVLLDEAMHVIPEKLRKCTPLAVKATAGLRLLPGSQAQDILKAISERLKEKYPFDVREVEIMDGRDEGVFAWLTANYLLGTMDGDSHAVLDLGGASTQIVFEPKYEQVGGKLEDGEHKYELQFGGKTYVLYQHSYLGYGLMKARERIHQLVEFMGTVRITSDKVKLDEEGLPRFANPCVNKGTRRRVDLPGKGNVTMEGGDVGGFEACNRVVELVMAKDSICELRPCSFDGVYQPSLMDTFQTGKVLLLSYFYDRLAPLLTSSPASTEPTLPITQIADLAKMACGGAPAWDAYYHANSNSNGNSEMAKEALKELTGRPESCLDLTFMHALLRLGYEFDQGREVKIGKRIKGTELGWCLGAVLQMVSGGNLKCLA